MISLRSTLCAFTLLIIASTSDATHCYGTIKALYIDASGNVLIQPSFRNDWLQICNSVSAWNSIDPITCKSWTALATTLRVTQEQSVIYYASSTLACDTIPAYGAAPAPGYLMYYVP